MSYIHLENTLVRENKVHWHCFRWWSEKCTFINDMASSENASLRDVVGEINATAETLFLKVSLSTDIQDHC